MIKSLRFTVSVACLALASAASCHGAVGDLMLTIPSANAGSSKGWGGSLGAVSDSAVLVGRARNYGSDGPVHLVDIHTGQTLNSYLEPGSYSSSNDAFGTQVQAVGDYVLVGAFATDLAGTSGEDAGVVHVYDATTGTYLRTISNPNPSPSGSFGTSIAPFGDYALVGTYEDLSSDGAAYLVDPSSGQVLMKYENPTDNRFDNFGSTVASVGNDVLIGSRNGGVVYRFDSDNGQVVQTYTPPAGASTTLFGWKMLQVGDKLIVSSFQDWLAGNYAGAVHIYDYDSGSYLSTLTSPTPSAYDWFGYDMELLDENVLAVSENYDDSTVSAIGSVHLFDIDTGSLLTTIDHPTPAINYERGRFGEAIANVGGALVVGSSRDSLDDGVVYVFEGVIPEPATVSLIGVALMFMLTRHRV